MAAVQWNLYTAIIAIALDLKELLTANLIAITRFFALLISYVRSS